MKQSLQNINVPAETSCPDQFICPLTLDLMEDPVVTKHGKNYERKAILSHLDTGKTFCPLTRLPLTASGLIPNNKLKFQIRAWKHANGMANKDVKSSFYYEMEDNGAEKMADFWGQLSVPECVSDRMRENFSQPASSRDDESESDRSRGSISSSSSGKKSKFRRGLAKLARPFRPSARRVLPPSE